MRACERELRKERADERHEHILLRVPHIALRAEKSICGRAANDSRPPLDEFITRAESQTHAGNEKEEPKAASERCAAQEYLARDERAHEALHEVANAVVIVARERQHTLDPITKRHARVRPMPADQQHERVQQAESIDARRE